MTHLKTPFWICYANLWSHRNTQNFTLFNFALKPLQSLFKLLLHQNNNYENVKFKGAMVKINKCVSLALK